MKGLRGLLCLLCLPLLGCDQEEKRLDRRIEKGKQRELRAWDENCKDGAALLATSPGSPHEFMCLNKRHRIDVQPVTVADQTVAALIVCRCLPDSGK